MEADSHRLALRCAALGSAAVSFVDAGADAGFCRVCVVAFLPPLPLPPPPLLSGFLSPAAGWTVLSTTTKRTADASSASESTLLMRSYILRVVSESLESLTAALFRASRPRLHGLLPPRLGVAEQPLRRLGQSAGPAK